MQNSHSDVQQSSYRCINHGTHITGRSGKRFQGAESEFGHWGTQQPLERVPSHSMLLPARMNPRKREAVPREGLEGTGAPAGFDVARTTGDRAGGCRYHTGQPAALHRPSHPSLTASRDFLNWKKKSPSKNVINIRANSSEFGQSHRTAASTQN